jgi:glycosyltransferase involved in cell wall biosynthesis
LRILHVLEPATGGVASHVRDLATEQAFRGHEVTVVCRGALAEALGRQAVRVIELELRPELVAPAADARAAAALARLLRRREWDVVHTHEAKAGALVRPIAAALRLPLVHSPHTYAYLTQAQRGRGGARRALTLRVEQALSRLARVVVLPSAYLRDAAVADGAVPAARAVVVHNGVRPIEVDRPRRAQPVVGWVGRMTEERDPATFVAAVRGAEFETVMIGDGPAAPPGALPFAGAGAALSMMDVYVSTSWFETFGIGLVEAMQAGLPVVATDVGAVREVVGDAGLFVPPRDPAAVREAIERLLADSSLREKLGAAGRERAARFTVGAMTDGIEAAYQRCMGR